MDQPNSSTYPAKLLEIFPEEQRSLNDPPYDVTKRPKYWKDTSQTGDPTTFVSYTVFHQSSDGTWSSTLIWMPAGEALVTNFPNSSPSSLPSGTPYPTLPKAWEAPVRALLPNERLLPSPFGLLISRTDLSTTLGTFTVEDHNAIMAIKEKLGA